MVSRAGIPTDGPHATHDGMRPLHAHPLLVAVVAGLAIAAASGYIIRATLLPVLPITTSAAPHSKAGSTESEAKTRYTILWDDEGGAFYRAKMDRVRLDQFLRRRQRALEAARVQSREAAAGEIPAALRPVFAGMTARVPGYADWYYAYTTKYELMGHALIPALDYLGARLDGSGRPDRSLIQAVEAHIVEYIEQQYAGRVVQRRETEIRLQTAFDQSYGDLHARWRGIVGEERAAARAFITANAGPAERLSPTQAAALSFSMNGGGDEGSNLHKDGVVTWTLRRGLLSVVLTVPKSDAPWAEPDIADAAGSDEISHVIINLFDKLVGPVVAQMGNMALGAFAGSAVGGTTAGFGTAIVVPIGAAVPVGAAIGLAATVVAEMLSNRLEESLTRPEFEATLRQTVNATGNAIESGMISVLDQHIEAWYADAANPVAVR